MIEIDMQEMTNEFLECWNAAGSHLSKQVDGGIPWLRAHPYPPFLEHFSFRLGNQLFFIRVEDVDGKVHGPGSLMGLASVARDTQGVACILPMKRTPAGWIATGTGWCLIDPTSGRLIDPPALVSDEDIEMTDRETHDMAVSVVTQHLQQNGLTLMSWQCDPRVDPSIWFVGATGQPEWVVVRAVRYPTEHAQRPSNWDNIAQGLARMSTTGHFASVALASAEQPQSETLVPLWRGHGMHVRFTGLE